MIVKTEKHIIIYIFQLMIFENDSFRTFKYLELINSKHDTTIKERRNFI